MKNLRQELSNALDALLEGNVLTIKEHKNIGRRIDAQALGNSAQSEALSVGNNEQAKDVCPKCGNYGKIYSDDGTRWETCECHY